MKNAYCILLLSMTILLMANTNDAQAADKIAFVDVEGVFEALPQAAALENKITNEFQSQMQEIKRVETNLQNLIRKHNQQNAVMSAQELNELEQEILTLRETYDAESGQLQKAMQFRFLQERNKLLELINKVINEVAIEQGYDAIFLAGAAKYITPSKNITDVVIDKVARLH